MAAPPKNPILNLFKVNLLIQKNKQTKLYTRFLKWLLSSGRFIVIIVDLLVIVALITRYKMDADLAALHDNINREVNYINQMQNYQQAILQTQLQLATIKDVKKANQNFPNALNAIAQAIPQDISLNSVSLNRSKQSPNYTLAIVGRSPNTTELSAFTQALQNEHTFSDVTLTNMAYDGSQIVFSLTGNLTEGGAN